MYGPFAEDKELGLQSLRRGVGLDQDVTGVAKREVL
jgi:hypothetical protein